MSETRSQSTGATCMYRFDAHYNKGAGLARTTGARHENRKRLFSPDASELCSALRNHDAVDGRNANTRATSTHMPRTMHNVPRGQYARDVWDAKERGRMGWGRRGGRRAMHANAYEYNSFADRLALPFDFGPLVCFRTCHFLWTVCGPFCGPTLNTDDFLWTVGQNEKVLMNYLFRFGPRSTNNHRCLVLVHKLVHKRSKKSYRF